MDWQRCKGLVVDFYMFLPWSWINLHAPAWLASSLLHFSMLGHLFRLSWVQVLLLSAAFPHHLLLVWANIHQETLSCEKQLHPGMLHLNQGLTGNIIPHQDLTKYCTKTWVHLRLYIRSLSPVLLQRIMPVSTFKGMKIHLMINPAHQAGDKAQTWGEKLMTSLLLPPVQVMLAVSTILLHSGCLSFIASPNQELQTLHKKAQWIILFAFFYI